jgi:putative thioredoxin
MFGEPCPWIIETTKDTFEKDVIERSMQLPVIVDFWATWCGPCQELGPTLEKLTREANGKFVLVKVDVDKNQEIAGWFGVQQIPAVFAIVNGQPVDQFMGNLPEEEIRPWINQFLPSPAESLVMEAMALESSNSAEAIEKYQAALELQPDMPAASIGMTRSLVAQHKDDEAKAVIAQLEKRGFLEPEAQQLKTELELRAAALESGGVGAARAAAAANPENLDLQIQLAEALAAAHAYPEALEICLTLVKQHKATMGDKAKNTMVQIFTVLGASSELAQQYRRKLSTAFY